MKKVFLIITTAILFFSCCDKKSKKILDAEGISELSYLIDYISRQKDKDTYISVENFNSLFDALKVYQLKDSSIIFINKIIPIHNNKDMYIIQFRNNLLSIYKNIPISDNEVFGNNILGLLAQTNAVYLRKKDKIFIPEYNIQYSSKHDKVDFCGCPFSEIIGVLQSFNNKYILYYECDEKGCFVEGFKHYKTITNNILYPLPKVFNGK
jgi:hypothetical protein